ncbi:hypothetical protein PIB30_053154 [Stylosanthes scabra]|uniref:Patellin-3 n=1 Tax=Stylosanthes scabra TaxID=79078 RepID=A0ABU6SIX5_9FABA|nr:hypothetical protein [Stylosanthes scabra]
MAEEAPVTSPPPPQEEAVLHVDHSTVTTTTTTTTAIAEKEHAVEDEKKENEKEKEEEASVAANTNTTGGGEDSKASDDEKVPESGSFKEESTKVSELPENQKKALQELKTLIQTALNNHEFSSAPKQEEKHAPVEKEKEKEENKKEEEQEEAEKNPLIEENKNSSEEKEPAVDDDGAKTVEAIEETVIAVSEPAPKKDEEEEEEAQRKERETNSTNSPEEVSIWGVPLLADERSDVILLKFLRARDFRVKESLAMIKNTIKWRKEFKIDELVEEEEDIYSNTMDLEKAVYMQGYDKEGHPVCYNIYGEFQNKDVYKKAFSDEEKRERFLKWRIKFLERSIRKLDFWPGGISTIVQVNDLKNSPGPAKWELRQATKQALQLLQDNYPEFVAKQVFINVPWWYLAVNRMISPFLTQRTKSKFVFAGPSKTAETLLRYIGAEQLPVKYGGLSKDGKFGNNDAVTEITVRPAAKHTVEFPVTENCVLSWELRVIGWDISYGAEFVPNSEGSYTVIIQKARKVAASEEPVLCNSYKIGEPGKVVLTIDNQSSKKKKLLYRLKTKSE